ncbi:MAG: RpiB/LacA/LacB family sugar-phosphate isomerase [Candidatus Latescibacterota bacterium]
MNQQELVEAVIKEVKRVLALRGVQIGPASQAPVAPETANTRPRASTVATSGNPNPGGNGSDLTGKQVIVVKDVQGMQGGILRIARKAVVTPMAIDYLREKGVKIERVDIQENKESASAAAGVALVGLAVSPDFPGNSSMLNSLLASKGLQVREFKGQSYEAAINNMCNAVASGAVHFGVCLENTGMLGPIHANRNQAVRAVHCRDMYEARAARVDIGANVVVLDANSDPEYVIAGFLGM